jgi:hypothetical protein
VLESRPDPSAGQEPDPTCHLEDLKPTASVRGLLPDTLATVVSVQWFGSEALELTYKTPTGKIQNELLYRHHEPRLQIVMKGRPWSFDGEFGWPPGLLVRPCVPRVCQLHAHMGTTLPAPATLDHACQITGLLPARASHPENLYGLSTASICFFNSGIRFLITSQTSS